MSAEEVTSEIKSNSQVTVNPEAEGEPQVIPMEIESYSQAPANLEVEGEPQVVVPQVDNHSKCSISSEVDPVPPSQSRQARRRRSHREKREMQRMEDLQRMEEIQRREEDIRRREEDIQRRESNPPTISGEGNMEVEQLSHVAPDPVEVATVGLKVNLSISRSPKTKRLWISAYSVVEAKKIKAVRTFKAMKAVITILCIRKRTCN